MTGIPVRNNAGGSVTLETVALANGNQAPIHILCDGNGVPYTAGHPLLTAPAIYPAVPVDRSGVIATPGAVALDVAASALRKGGWFRAGVGNQGDILLTLKNLDGSTHTDKLGPNDTFSLTINGYVIPTEIVLVGTVAGDTFSGVEFQ